MSRVTAIIADDEALMRANLREQLAIAWPELDIVAEASDGDEAVSLCDIATTGRHFPLLSGLTESAADRVRRTAMELMAEG